MTLVLAEAFERRHYLQDKGIFTLSTLSNDDSLKVNLCLKKRCQILVQNVLRQKLKTPNLEFYNDEIKVAIEDPVIESLLGFLNVLQLNARILINFHRRRKFANAKALSDYNVVCLCETWLNENIESAEMLLHNYTLYRPDEKLQKDMNTHGGVMVAIENNIRCKLLKTDQLACSLNCKLEINIQIIFICVFYNPPKGRRYSYVKEKFEKLIAAVPKTKAALICRDLNVPNTNWSNFCSEDEEEHSIQELIENAKNQEGVELHTRGAYTLEVTFFRICSPVACREQVSTQTCGCCDHKTVKFSLECPNSEETPIKKRQKLG